MTTLFGDDRAAAAATGSGKKKAAARTPPAAWVARRLVGHGVPEDRVGAMDAGAAFRRLAAIEAAREAEGLPVGADDPARQGPDGWPGPLRAAVAADLAADLAAGLDDLTGERLLDLIEGALPATTRAERVRIVRGLAAMLGGNPAARPEGEPVPDTELHRLADDGCPHDHPPAPAAGRPDRGGSAAGLTAGTFDR